MNSKASPALRGPRIRVGCAGWSITAAHRGLFGDGGSLLARYATLFDCAEINSSFYRPHQRKTYAHWADSVPDDFRFSVKVPKSVTHEARLLGTGSLLDRFVDESSGLGGKLAGLLVQLPPSLQFDARVAATFFSVLRRRWSGAVACEPRHASWFDPATAALLQRHRIARVGADPALSEAARIPGSTSPWRYWRWHGSPRMYYSDYDDVRLRALAAEVHAHTPARAEAWIIFDNTAHGFATSNAARLQQLLRANESRDVRG